MFLILRCRKCGRFLYAKTGTKTRKCICGKVSQIERMILVDRAEDEREAGKKVRFYQEKVFGEPEFITFK